ncbi:type II toxin-antitoxin system YafO family toxin [Marinomonas piezotolerans]|uniref:Type II toxin-antitoxin system YafO family toxin n=1 Tax=Marinomonas piezotolerans TaxID=2213058 RepID=A0A370UAB7_9GAMM|nr:type II toxin-antitoxin system YafO family toxin [Marinomonas piezotolerans]RDL44691.1 type II toxin-antitoxin system YafO family toxin [Marinomonas piezotolerans]
MTRKVKVYLSDLLNSHPDANLLTEKFALYKETGIPPDDFGRDGDNRYPLICLQEEVHHIHLAHLPIHFRKWPKIRAQYERKSDKALLYCPGFFDSDSYLLIAVLEPPAHDQQESNELMEAVGQIAESFRLEN